MSKNAWQTLGLAALTVVTLAGVVWLFADWPPQPPRSNIAAASSASAEPEPKSEPPVAVFLGDSYTEGTGASSTSNYWTSIVAEEMGWQEANFGEGGTGYATAGTIAGRSPYPDRADNVAAEVVVVAGGQNDLGEPTRDILRGINQTFTTLQVTVPDARIIAVSPTVPSGEAPKQAVVMRDAVEAAAARTGAEFVDATTPNWFADPQGLLTADGIHLNDEGHALFARSLLAQIQ